MNGSLCIRTATPRLQTLPSVVLEQNTRARRFYEKCGWRLNGDTRIVSFPPYPTDVGYTIEL